MARMAGILSEDRTEVEAALEELLDQENVANEEVCRNLLSVLNKHPELQAKVAEVFALLAREEEFREVAVSCGVVPKLCPLLASEDVSVHLHTLRAIGNLCFDHDGNRELVLSSGGCPLLVERLKSSSLLPAKREYDRVKCVACGCLLNTVNDNDKLCQEVLGLCVLQPLSDLLAQPGEDITTITMGLKALYVLLAASGDQSSLLSPPCLSQAFSNLLSECVSEKGAEQLPSLLETMELAINANDEVKVAVVEAGCVKSLMQISDHTHLMKAIDILILICGNDESLRLLSEEPELVSTALEWLSEAKPLKQRANAALLLANMSRTDEMCEMLVSRGLVTHLLSLTEIEEPEELSGKVHVSALSALRNLCLPAGVKSSLVESGVLKAALRCLRDSQWPHVHFKCLGIARLLASLEEVCRELVLSEAGTVTLVCERCQLTEPPHVKIEGSRLLSAIIKNCHSEEVMRTVISEGGVKLIVSLLDSAHLSLRNEALIALNLLAGAELAGDALTEGDVMGGVWGVVLASDSSPELVSNAMTFLLQLHKKAGVREKLTALDGWEDKLRTLSQDSSETVSDLAKNLAKVSFNSI